MKCLGIVLLVALGAWTLVSAEEKYTDKYDNLNVDDIIANPRLYNKYMDCVLNKGSCTPEGKLLKDVIPDALKSKCARCTDKQKVSAEKIIKYLLNEKRDDWNKLLKIYDPEGKFKSLYKDEAKKKFGIELD